MDSGVVDVIAIGTAAPERYEPGVLHESIGEATYNAPFVAPATGDATWRVNPNTDGQMSGSVHRVGNQFVGRVPYDLSPARSFAPAKVEATPQTDPPTWVDSDSDGYLAEKKALAVLCPASIFTGRCRLYVQAVYGQHTYEYAGHKVSRTPALPQIVSSTGAAPALLFNSYKESADEIAPDVLVDTSSGVWLDPETGRHWLFCPVSGGRLMVYPMRSIKCAEELRSQLITVGEPWAVTSLNDADRRRLESYILASALPYSPAGIIATGAVISSSYSMAYGWHWNFTGLTADVVVNGTFDQGGINSAMVSTHYRLQVGHSVIDGVDAWTADQTVIEGPVQWSVYRSMWTIAEPDYTNYALVKSTPKNTSVFACDAPFYCFYVGDELKVCRVNVTLNPAVAASRVMSDRYCISSTPYSNIEHATVGELDGFMEESPGESATYVASFSCGNETVSGLYAGRTVTRNRYDLTDKVPQEDSIFEVGFGWGSFMTTTLDVGYPFADGTWPQTEYMTGQFDNSFTGKYYYKLSSVVHTDAYSSSATLVVPFYDSQAIYMQGTTLKTISSSGNVQLYDAGLYGFEYKRITKITTPDRPSIVKYSWNNGGGPSGAIPIDLTSVSNYSETSTIYSKLVCVAGAVDATFSHIAEFRDNAADFVGAGYYTLSSANVDNPVVIAHGIIDPIGIESAPAVPVLVGCC